jgi:lipopolysaccharide transport system permease protein
MVVPLAKSREFGKMVRNLWSQRHLILSLIIREYQIRYRQSFIGMLWAVLLPLSTLGAGTFVFKHVAGVETGEQSYALGTLAALIPWTFFASSLSFGVGSVVAQRAMITKLAFPRFVLPLGIIGTCLIDLAIAAVIFVALAYAIGDGIHLSAVWVPALLLIEFALVIGLVFLGSAANVFARDIKLAIPLLMQLWLLLTPVLYPLEAVPKATQDLYLANPMTGLVESFRRVLLGGQGPEFGVLLPALIGAIVSLIFGTWYFGVTERRFADVV